MNKDIFKFRVWWEKEKRYRIDVKMHPAEHFCQKDFIVEQCTGLKDKNGNLIYIGDIIKCGNGPLNTATVQYENGENFIDGIYPFNLYHDCGAECHCQLRDYPEYACEIIGNIHEHKESQ